MLTEVRIDLPDFSKKLCSMEAKRVAFEQERLLRFDYGFTKGTPTLVLLQAFVSALFDHKIVV